MSDPVESPGRRHGRAVGWSFVSDGSRLMSSLGVFFLVAALVDPDELGAATVSITIMLLAEAVQKQGLEAAVIQRPHLTDAEMRSSFWLMNGFSFVVAAGLFFLAPALADVNDDGSIEWQVRVLCLVLLMRGISLMPDALLRREMRFRELSIRTSASVIVGAIAAIVVVALGGGAWALIVQQIVIAALDAILVWRSVTWRPSRGIDRAATRSLMAFSAATFLASLTAFVYLRIEGLVISAAFGTAAIGIYSSASRLIDQGFIAAVTGVLAVSLPAMSVEYANTPAYLERFRWFLRLISLMAVLIATVGAVVAADVAAVLGDEWEPAVPAIRILCVAALIRPIGFIVTPALQARGRPFRLAAFSLYSAIGAVVAVGLAIPIGAGRDIETQAIVVAASRLGIELLVMMPLSLLFLRRHGDVPPRHAVVPVVRGIGQAIAVVTIVGGLRWAGGPLVDSPVARLVIWGSVTTVVAVIVILSTDSTVRSIVARNLPIGTRRAATPPETPLRGGTVMNTEATP